MLYSYSTVVSFAQNLAIKVGLRSGFTKQYNHWNEAQTHIELLKLQAPQYGVSFAAYIMAIAQAKKYLDQRDNESIFSKTFNSDERHQYLDQHVEWSIRYFNQLKRGNPALFADVVPPLKTGAEKNHSIPVKAPLKPSPTVHGASGAKSGLSGGGINSEDLFDRLFLGIDKKFTQIVRDKEVDDFMNSEAFKKLKKYQQDVLTTDLRSHSYFCGILNLKVDKAPVLKKFIDELETAVSMFEVRQQLNRFYRGKNSLNDNKPSTYQILNSGQNITTRLFGFFGVKTTTISLIDDLAASMSPMASRRYNLY